MQEIIHSCNETHANWGFKDPRTVLVYPFWATELPEHKIITIYRSPGEIWSRFCYKRWYYSFKNPYNAWKLMKGWGQYNLKILDYLENTTMDYIVLNYSEFMANDAEFDRLKKFSGIKLTDQRKKNLYRNRKDSYPLLKLVAWLVYKQTGWRSEEIVNRFETLRQKQIAVYSRTSVTT
jgi:hypothetical protein